MDIYQCFQCNQNFSKKCYLQSHVNAIHIHFVCHVCYKENATKEDLDSHLLTHGDISIKRPKNIIPESEDFSGIITSVKQEKLSDDADFNVRNVPFHLGFS